MSDFCPRDLYPHDLYPCDALERELAHHLAPVKAPESLWDTVSHRTAQSRFVRSPSIAWYSGRKLILSPALAVILLTVAAGAVWKSGQAANVHSSNAAPQKISAGASALSVNTARSGANLNQIANLNQSNATCPMCHT